jgi:diketogulonate reductase-like aldo/keto reductase
MSTKTVSRFIGQIAVPVLGQGTWKIEHDRPAAVAALRRGLDLGLTHIDTAEMYGGGESEKVVGEAIHGRRDGVFLVSKVLPSHADAEGVRRACERSLKHLGTDHLDLYLLHWRGGVPLEETFRAFTRLVEQGKVRAFGVSNFDVDDLVEAKANGGEAMVCNQVLYHLQERTIEAAVLPWCERNDVAVVAYSPFGQHDFPTRESTAGKVLLEIAEGCGKTARQVALSFLVRSQNVFAIPKSGDVRHVEENAGALGFELAPDDLRKIDSAFPLRAKSHLPML